MTKMLSLGYSTCPNDTFIFHAMTHGCVADDLLRFQPVLEDVETLNQKARSRILDITKLSFAAIGHLPETYGLLRSGAALGRGCGPLVVDYGVIIHEGRFTFGSHGLVDLLDLGQWWEDETGLPIPLGGIAIRRDLGHRLPKLWKK